MTEKWNLTAGDEEAPEKDIELAWFKNETDDEFIVYNPETVEDEIDEGHTQWMVIEDESTLRNLETHR